MKDDMIQKMTDGGATPRGSRRPGLADRFPAQEGQFSPKETGQLKDVMILVLANLVHSDLDREIGEALMTGRELGPAQLQHILDEARNTALPASHAALMQKIYDRISRRP